MASIYDWSLTAANNANADASINWAEGQAPSTVNGSARQMMSRIKSLLDDLGGVAAATGTANAISVTSATGFSAHADGLLIAFKATAANTAATTLNVNTIGAKPVVKMTLYGESALIGGEIQNGGIYELVYCSHLNGAAGAWLLLNPSNLDIVAPGIGAPYFGSTPPTGWLLCNGAAVSRTTYARLFSAIGTTWGSGNGSTTFNLPNGQNDFLRGASGTLPLGTRQSQAIQSHTHGVSDPGHVHNWGNTARGFAFTPGSTGSFAQGGSAPGELNTATAFTGISIQSTGGSETRPRNIAVNWIIKT